MKKVTLGRTKLTVGKDALGALPLQRDDRQTALALIHACLDAGMDFIDTARAYSDSEEKLGEALGGRREALILASKTMETTREGIRGDIETSLQKLRTDYIDIYQLHNPDFVPKPGDESGVYEELLALRGAGKLRFIGFTNHRLSLAREAALSGFYDTVQFPFSYLANEGERELVAFCQRNNVGFIAMKALSGGLLRDVGLARKWLNGYGGVLPIWGLQHLSELEKLKAAMEDDSPLTPEETEKIRADRRELTGSFCRGCGYCMPCPEEITINQCARMSLMIRRAPESVWFSEYWQGEMKKTENCTRCGACAEKCPYGLETAALLRRNHDDYFRQLAGQ
jgi:aryl-alcohol dehydrogenase-like predicted oxidoreductase